MDSGEAGNKSGDKPSIIVNKGGDISNKTNSTPVVLTLMSLSPSHLKYR